MQEAQRLTGQLSNASNSGEDRARTTATRAATLSPGPPSWKRPAG